MKAIANVNYCGVCHILEEGIGVCVKTVEQLDGTQDSHRELVRRIALVDSATVCSSYHKKYGVIVLPFAEPAAVEDTSRIYQEREPAPLW